MKKEISLILEPDYLSFLNKIKERLKVARLKTARIVNQEVIEFYWYLGNDILKLQAGKKHWGNKLLTQLAHDLRKANPGASGFSQRSLEYMRLMVSLYPDFEQFTQQAAAQLPWSILQLLMDKFKHDPQQIEWYAEQTIVHGWSRSLLSMQIKGQLYTRQQNDAKVSNYKHSLPSPQSDLAQEILKNPYSFDFLTLGQDAHEREIERALTEHIKDFLLELGSGFAFVGTQVPIEVDGEDFIIDVLFYHLKLRSYVVIELKAKKFTPADLGQLSFYLTAVDEKLRHPQDNPTIGILLCESRSKIIAEYALKKIKAPIGISEYILAKALPKELKTNLPTIEEIEMELNEVLSSNDPDKANHEKQ